MLVYKEAINPVKDSPYSYEQFPAFCRVLAVAQIVRHQFELRCQTAKPPNR
jgi:hypothetical protein